MRIKAESAADFGIPLTGEELENFNELFLEKSLPSNIFMSSAKRMIYYIAAAVLFAASIFFGVKFTRYPLAIAGVIALPAAIAGTYIYSLYKIKDRTIRTLTQNLCLIAQLLCFMRILASFFVAHFVSSYSLFICSYLLFTCISAVSMIIGMKCWSKKILKLRVNPVKAFGGNKLTRSISTLIGIAAVPVVRYFSDNKAIMLITFVICTVTLCAIMWALVGFAIGNFRYRVFLQKNDSI